MIPKIGSLASFCYALASHGPRCESALISRVRCDSIEFRNCFLRPIRSNVHPVPVGAPHPMLAVTDLVCTHISAPLRRSSVATVCLLCTQRHSRHYLPFLTMSCNAAAAALLLVKS
jgi:hypothetical protein